MKLLGLSKFKTYTLRKQRLEKLGRQKIQINFKYFNLIHLDLQKNKEDEKP